MASTRIASPAPRRHRQPPPWLVLTSALVGLFAAYYNTSVLALAVGDLSEEFSTTTTTMAWVVTGPLLAFAVLGPTAGKLGDLYGRRRVYLIAMAGCGIFSGAAIFATSAWMLIAFRSLSAVCGLSTAPAGMAIVSAVFPAEQRVKALGFWGFAMSGGPMIGMIIGGPILDHGSWRWLFVIQTP